MIDPSSAIGGNAFCGIIATLNDLSGKLLWKESVIELQALSSLEGWYPDCLQIAGRVAHAWEVCRLWGLGRQPQFVCRSIDSGEADEADSSVVPGRLQMARDRGKQAVPRPRKVGSHGAAIVSESQTPVCPLWGETLKFSGAAPAPFGGGWNSQAGVFASGLDRQVHVLIERHRLAHPLIEGGPLVLTRSPALWSPSRPPAPDRRRPDTLSDWDTPCG